jgi:hypothetical protein
VVAGTFTLDLPEGALPDDGAALAIDRQADVGHAAVRGHPDGLFLRALARAVADGSGEVAVSLGEDWAYRVRDALDDALTPLPAGSPAAVTLRAVLAAWDAFTGWELEAARQRDRDNGLRVRDRTAVAAA